MSILYCKLYSNLRWDENTKRAWQTVI